MKILYTLLIALSTFVLFSCSKETPTTQVNVMNNLLTNKNWYLDYSITEAMTSTTPVVLKSYVGQSTYFITCLLYTSPSPRDRTRSRMPSSA